MKELEFQAEEYDKTEFFRIADTCGGGEETITSVWMWFEILPKYPLDGTI
jgi:hypothetical protein